MDFQCVSFVACFEIDSDAAGSEVAAFISSTLQGTKANFDDNYC